MTLKIAHYYEDGVQQEEFKNVLHISIENVNNQKWLFLTFNMYSEEYKKFNGGQTAIAIDDLDIIGINEK